eukprot:TRINITY_DN5278_c0_g1_i2.p1 TRINITY_DN5278_c0_g1~~TRINITY_DN5278_c0_g1_i2.p1  ORF type:complete len:203 (+),score=43.31 TRINITY_DN5278_c0_g1_i2:53-661(+)
MSFRPELRVAAAQERWSRGSRNHSTLQCRPCAFIMKGADCPDGSQCNFCHAPHTEQQIDMIMTERAAAKAKTTLEKKTLGKAMTASTSASERDKYCTTSDQIFSMDDSSAQPGRRSWTSGDAAKAPSPPNLTVWKTCDVPKPVSADAIALDLQSLSKMEMQDLGAKDMMQLTIANWPVCGVCMYAEQLDDLLKLVTPCVYED